MFIYVSFQFVPMMMIGIISWDDWGRNGNGYLVYMLVPVYMGDVWE